MREISVASGEHAWPFSKGLVVESLMNADIPREPAIAIARRVEQRLLDENRRVVDPASLKTMVAEETRIVLGEDHADRLESQTSAFEDIVVIDNDTRIPFSKGILSRSLEQAGLPIRDAYELSKDIERTLRIQGVTRIERGGLEQRVLAEVERRFGREARDGYLARYHRATQINVLEDNGVAFPYSKGILAQSLMATGLSPNDAHRVAREVEVKLFERAEAVVGRDALREEVLDILQLEFGDDIARRYELLRSIRRPEKPLHILIGGVTGTGKSVLAAEVAYRLGITRIESTDSVRQVMRAMISRELLPTLHASSFDAWMTTLHPHELKQLERRTVKPSSDQLLDGFRDQVSQVTVGLRAIIERASDEHTSMVLEGVHIVPGFLPVEAFKDSTVVPMVVVVRNQEEHRKRFYLRDAETSQHRPMQHYLEHFDSIRELQNYVEEMARTVGVPIIDGESLDRAAEGAIEVIAHRVLASKPASRSMNQ
jgi:2-phosphoglycerate kinase